MVREIWELSMEICHQIPIRVAILGCVVGELVQDGWKWWERQHRHRCDDGKS